MADEEETKEEVEGEGASGGGKSKLLIFIIVGLLLVGGSIGGTLFFLGVFDDSPVAGEAVEGESDEEVADVKAQAMYFPIKPAFIINFQARGRQRYLQVEVTLMTRDQEVMASLQTHLPLIKNQLVMMFSGESYEELQTDEGKELMRQNALEAIQRLLEQEVGKAGVEQILFTNFVMQ